jgi:hypothetical protein
MEDAMSLRTIVNSAGAVGAMSLPTRAFGQVQYGYRVIQVQPDRFLDLLLIIALCLSALLLVAWLAGWLSSESSGSPCDCAECTAKRYAREANLLREITNHQDAHTVMMRGEIDHARTYGEYRERPDIAAHEQRLRELRSRLR